MACWAFALLASQLWRLQGGVEKTTPLEGQCAKSTRALEANGSMASDAMNTKIAAGRCYYLIRKNHIRWASFGKWSTCHTTHQCCGTKRNPTPNVADRGLGLTSSARLQRQSGSYSCSRWPQVANWKHHETPSLKVFQLQTLTSFIHLHNLIHIRRCKF